MDLQETLAKPDFNQFDDDQLVGQARLGDGAALEYLITKYKNFVRAKARSYFLIGADHEDIVQEGMIVRSRCMYVDQRFITTFILVMRDHRLCMIWEAFP